ncbi:MAG TPA: hypothetical protein VHF89_15330, partial [Solirubrobacteraceae bacterium]|nr:hypothetical protein [Solirubrobacteraceae bacterium]
MRLSRALALGLLHGPAELLPVSSSAHAALLLQDLEPDARKEAEVALHAGTLLALGPPRPRPWLALATAPPALAGLVLERPIERRLGTRRSIAIGLVAGAAAMVAADVAAARRQGIGAAVIRDPQRALERDREPLPDPHPVLLDDDPQHGDL